jgi:hypothetical protein
LTQRMTDVNASAGFIRQGLSRLALNTNGLAVAGRTSDPIYGLWHVTQMPALQGISEVNSAQMRGDDENPYVKGLWVKGLGFNLEVSTIVYFDGTGYHNVFYIKSAFIVAWNQHAQIMKQMLEANYRLIGYANNGYSVYNDARAIDMVTTQGP